MARVMGLATVPFVLAVLSFSAMAAPMRLGALRFELNEETAGLVPFWPDRLVSRFGMGVGGSQPTGFMSTEDRYFEGTNLVHNFTEDSLTGLTLFRYRELVGRLTNGNDDTMMAVVVLGNSPTNWAAFSISGLESSYGLDSMGTMEGAQIDFIRERRERVDNIGFGFDSTFGGGGWASAVGGKTVFGSG